MVTEGGWKGTDSEPVPDVDYIRQSSPPVLSFVAVPDPPLVPVIVPHIPHEYRLSRPHRA